MHIITNRFMLFHEKAVLFLEGDVVKQGQNLVHFNRDKIKKAGYSDQVMIIVTNTDDFSEVQITTGIRAEGNEEVIHTVK